MDINIEERVSMARANFASGYNCAQSVALAFADLYNIEPSLMATISAPFGGGIGRLREVCGTVSGMAIIGGFIAPSTDPKNQTAKALNYKLVKGFAEEFRNTNGSIICRELLASGKRPCAELVEIATRIVATDIALLQNRPLP